jgi:hypothetical protein
LKEKDELSVVVYTYNPSTWEAEAGRSRIGVSLGCLREKRKEGGGGAGGIGAGGRRRKEEKEEEEEKKIECAPWFPLPGPLLIPMMEAWTRHE